MSLSDFRSLPSLNFYPQSSAWWLFTFLFHAVVSQASVVLDDFITCLVEEVARSFVSGTAQHCIIISGIAGQALMPRASALLTSNDSLVMVQSILEKALELLPPLQQVMSLGLEQIAFLFGDE